jgi:hypothetical protein
MDHSVQRTAFSVQVGYTPVSALHALRSTLFVLLMALSGGCITQVFTPAKVCPGKVNVSEALEALRQQAKAAAPFRANGQCRMGFVTESGKNRLFNLPANVWINPPSELYMQGQATPGPQGLIFLGTNDLEFWLGIRPEISTFWWGKWSKAAGTQDLPISPRAVFESLGIAVADPCLADPNRWSLSAMADQDVLTWSNDQGRPIKRLFMERCDYRITRIEYLDQAGHVTVGVEMKRYERVAEGFFVPSRISIVAFAKGRRTQWAALNVDSFMGKTYSEQFRRRYFERPEPRGFETVIEVDGQ